MIVAEAQPETPPPRRSNGSPKPPLKAEATHCTTAPRMQIPLISGGLCLLDGIGVAETADCQSRATANGLRLTAVPSAAAAASAPSPPRCQDSTRQWESGTIVMEHARRSTPTGTSTRTPDPVGPRTTGSAEASQYFVHCFPKLLTGSLFTRGICKGETPDRGIVNVGRCRRGARLPKAPRRCFLRGLLSDHRPRPHGSLGV